MDWLNTLFKNEWDHLREHEAQLEELQGKIWQQKFESRVTMEELRADNAQLKMFCVAMMRLLLRKKVVTIEELNAMVQEVDREDGKQDGGLNAKVE